MTENAETGEQKQVGINNLANIYIDGVVECNPNSPENERIFANHRDVTLEDYIMVHLRVLLLQLPEFPARQYNYIMECMEGLLKHPYRKYNLGEEPLKRDKFAWEPSPPCSYRFYDDRLSAGINTDGRNYYKR